MMRLHPPLCPPRISIPAPVSKPSVETTADTESKPTIKTETERQKANAPLILSHLHGQASLCIQALNLRNAIRIPAWSGAQPGTCGGTEARRAAEGLTD